MLPVGARRRLWVVRAVAAPFALCVVLPAAAAVVGPVAAPPRSAVPVTASAAVPDDARRRAAMRAIDQCLPRLDAEFDVGRERVAARCPGMLEAIAASPLAANLPRDWQQGRNELSAGGLRALRRELAAPAAAARRAMPDALVLARLAAEARAGLEPGNGPWTRFSRWLRSLLERGTPRRGDAPLAGWLRDWSIPQRAWTLFGYAVLAALLGFAAWVLRSELRAAGLTGRFGRRAAAAAVPHGSEPRQAAAYESLPPLERPAWLLRELAGELQRLGRLQAAAALTARELAQRATLESPGDREPLRELADVAERVRYAARAPSSAEFAPALEAARQLLRRLEAQPAGPAP